MTPKDLDGNSIYNKSLHMPIPTMDDIFSVTGIDIQIAGTTQENDRQIQSLTIKAYNHLMSKKRDKRALEYLIAKDRDFRDAFTLYASTFIGQYILLGEDIHDNVDIKNAIDNSVLVYNKFDRIITDEEYRSDY